MKPTIDNNMSKTNAETLSPSIVSYKEVYLESYIIHGITVGVFGALTPPGTSGTSSASSLRENDQVASHERRKAQEI